MSISTITNVNVVDFLFFVCVCVCFLHSFFQTESNQSKLFPDASLCHSWLRTISLEPATTKW